MPTLAENRRALHEYTILDTLEAGIVLTGQEVKAAKLGQLSLKAAYVTIKNNEAYLINTHISQYAKAVADPNYDANRDRKLLLSRKEISEILERKDAEGLTVVPLAVFTKKDLVKVRIGIARGKKQIDKRESIKKREIEKRTRRIVQR